MAYNALSQIDQEVGSNASMSDASDRRSPLVQSSGFEPLAIDFDNLGGNKHMDTAKVAKDNTSISLKSVVRSRGASTTTSYHIVEDDDYKVVDQERNLHDDRPRSPVALADEHRHVQDEGRSDNNKPLSHPVSPEPLISTPVNKAPVPLRHPTPDLQSIQGAYVGNVERLERSAARISMDTGDGMDELEVGQTKRRSGSASRYGSGLPRSRGVSIGSLSHPRGDESTAATPSVYSAGGYSPSPRQAALGAVSAPAVSRLRSGSTASRLAKVPEPENENENENENAASYQPDVAGPVLAPPPHLFNPETNANLPFNPNLTHAPLPQSLPTEEERPQTAGSGDTYQQATNLFKDFDGVHFTPHSREQDTIRRVSLAQPPLAAQPEHYNVPNPGQNMVFYPAPVPAILNLPQRLSHKPTNVEHEKRRTQMIASLPPEGRKSAAWLPEAETTDEPERPNKRASNLPPQLRASTFFEQPSAKLDIRVQQNSAVATLDDILDAAAHAPVSAFTDHPIVGHVGSEVYGKPKLKKRRNKNDKDNRASLNAHTVLENPPSPSNVSNYGFEGPNHQAEGESTPFTTSYEDGNDRNAHDSRDDVGKARSVSENSGSEKEEREGDEEDEQYVGAPTTLLAELQLRKQEQKQRNRTAATAFPNGMHSTLLELDSVAQRQRDKRNQRHVRLAWEDPAAAERQEPDDEDIPLAVLFPEKNTLLDENRPLGLMEKLLLEENEPLSRRRARMRGEPLHGPPPPPEDPIANKRASAAYTLDVPGLEDEQDGGEDENETLAQRVRRLKAREDREKNNFADDLLSRFGDQPNTNNSSDGDKLKQDAAGGEPEEETLGQRRKRLQAEARNRQSTSSLLQPPRLTMADHPASTVTRPTAGLHSQHHSFQYPSSTFAPMGSRGASMSHLPYPMNPAYQYGNGIPPPNMMQNPYAMSNTSFAAVGQPETMVDPRQRDIIDRWRLSVRH